MTISGKTKPSVLLVEDQNENIDLLRDILGDDYTLRVSIRGRDALRSISVQPPDLVLLDVGLPDMDGFEVCQRINTSFSELAIPIIFITAATTELDEQRGLELGAVDYIHKPYQKTIVRNRVRNQIELSSYRHHLEDQVALRISQIRETQKGLLASLALATEYRHRETGEHIIRTKQLIAQFLHVLRPMFPQDLTEESMELIIEASLLHDIGKIAIPDAVLLKTGSLTKEEFLTIKEHTRIGQELLSNALSQYPHNEFLRIAVQMAAFHHERWDGTGYPYGLKEEDIPLPARIMALIDVYESLTADRVYRCRFSHEEAMNIIVEGDGRVMPEHFDPRILSVFIAHHQEFENIGLTTI